jgi:transcription-repair coupling factor (superfamily II helicase)
MTAALRSGRKSSPWIAWGAWQGAVAPWVAAMAWNDARPLLVIVPQPPDAETIAADLSCLLGVAIELFPAILEEMGVDALRDQDFLTRLQVLNRLQSWRRQSESNSGGDPLPPAPILVTTLPALLQPVPSPRQLTEERRSIATGQRHPVNELRSWLIQQGYHTTTAVQLPGEFTMRGGIVDVFPPDAEHPFRIEFFDDEVESIRQFDVVTQRSLQNSSAIELTSAASTTQEDGWLMDYLPDDAIRVLWEPDSIRHVTESFVQRAPFPDRFRSIDDALEAIVHRHAVTLVQVAPPDGSWTGDRIPLGDVDRFGGDLEKLAEELTQQAASGRQTTLLCVSEGERQRLEDLLAQTKVERRDRIHLAVGSLSLGFELPPDGPLVLTVHQMLKRSQLRRHSKRVQSRAIDSFLDLRDGDLVVHLGHGIGVYRGLKMIERLGKKQEHLEIEFAEASKLFVPTTKIDLVQRYVGGTQLRPKLAKIGSGSWARQKQAAESAVRDMAADLLDLQARRRSLIGIQFSADTVWQHQFDGSFPYQETPDQWTAIESVKTDMTSKRPMDRLICGDVGFGKTEVAMRAAFKAIDNGYQVAVLVPTTVLAEQHYRTFRERMAEFPVEIGKLSRFVQTSQQRQTLAGLASGQIDLVIGTHRVASQDVRFCNLGLVIIDEEQRFGVAIKERLKQVRPNVDVLTLSATPIPRTLHMSLLGVRDISNLETPPADRLSVETRVVRFDEKLIRQAIQRELNRDGQIFFVHNRISDLPILADLLHRIVPEARIGIGHGQMEEGRMEEVMLDFIEHRTDILLSTTIIESGLDIPNANTIFINQADHYGLAELHQLRGRVGRYHHQAYCYLLVERNKHLESDAAKRLHAIEEFSQIGAGFGIAMRDLEIRGAGNLLGTAQSGHIATVGYELYCQLLEQAVRTLTHQPPKLSIDVEMHLPIDAYLPTEYVPEMRHKIDRFGELPEPVERLMRLAELRIDATLWQIRAIQVDDKHLQIAFADRRRIEMLAKRHRGQLRVLDDQNAYWPLPEGDVDYLQLLQDLLRPPSESSIASSPQEAMTPPKPLPKAPRPSAVPRPVTGSKPGLRGFLHQKKDGPPTA